MALKCTLSKSHPGTSLGHVTDWSKSCVVSSKIRFHWPSNYRLINAWESQTRPTGPTLAGIWKFRLKLFGARIETLELKVSVLLMITATLPISAVRFGTWGSFLIDRAGPQA